MLGGSLAAGRADDFSAGRAAPTARDAYWAASY
jgi:hypothetical protein